MNYKALRFAYYSSYRVLHIRVELNKLLNKDIIVDSDYNEVIKQYQKQFYEVGFKYVDPLDKLNRIDYKQDIITPNIDLYIKLLKKGTDDYRSLNQNKTYDTSIYYNSKSKNYNIYNKIYFNRIEKMCQ